jgi:hypothetical protein
MHNNIPKKCYQKYLIPLPIYMHISNTLSPPLAPLHTPPSQPLHLPVPAHSLTRNHSKRRLQLMPPLRLLRHLLRIMLRLHLARHLRIRLLIRSHPVHPYDLPRHHPIHSTILPMHGHAIRVLHVILHLRLIRRHFRPIELATPSVPQQSEEREREQCYQG